MCDSADFTFSAFLISSALTNGYSPYSRKLGHWCSLTNLMNDSGIGLPVLGEALEVFKGRVHSQTDEQRDRVVCVLVEIRVENALST